LACLVLYIFCFDPFLIGVPCTRPGNSAILLETGSIDHSRALSIPSALRVNKKDVNKLGDVNKHTNYYYKILFFCIKIVANSYENVSLMDLNGKLGYALFVIIFRGNFRSFSLVIK